MSTTAAGSNLERVRLMAELARELVGAIDDPRQLLERVARRVGATFGDRCAIRLVSDDGRSLEAAALYHPDPERLAAARGVLESGSQLLGEGVTGRVAQTGVAELIPVLDTVALRAGLSPEGREALDRIGAAASLIVVPLVTRGAVIGVASVSRGPEKPPYDAEDLHLLEDVAAHAALALANTRANARERASFQALAESEEAFRLLFDASPLPLIVFDTETLAPLAVSHEAVRLFGYPREQLMLVDCLDLLGEARTAVRHRLIALGDRGSTGVREFARRDGSRFTAKYRTSALRFHGRRARLVALEDISVRHEADQTRALLASIVESANDAVISKRPDGTITSWNAAAQRLFGYTPAEAIGQSIMLIVPGDRRGEEALIAERVSRGERVDAFETVRRRKDGSLVDIAVSVAPIFDAEGRVVGASKSARDLSAQREAERALRVVEDQLRQAQKMEAVGRLAGGIAHDFNNILTVILSYGALLRETLEPEHPGVDDVEQICRSAERAAELTRQLLVFSRQQVVSPTTLYLGEVLAAMHKMIQRIVGEDIELTSIAAPELAPIRADRGNVEQVIMNLVVNARDAMATGGKLTIEAANVELDETFAREHLGSTAGPHVMLAVTDTGIGMDPATLARVFEPFFTTKGVGKGTGLGLSTVFGIAQQCGGTVWVYSELGTGTTFKVYFRAQSASEARPPEPADAGRLQGTETILLVEDQPEVREVALGILGRCGYRVLAASDPRKALALADAEPGPIHLLLTDVVMPHVSGAELARRIVERRPDTRVLFMSGYTDDSVVRHGVLEDHVAFIQKPFMPQALARKVREVLDRASRRDG